MMSKRQFSLMLALMLALAVLVNIGMPAVQAQTDTLARYLKVLILSTDADSVKTAGGITAGSGNVAIVGTDGRIPALSSTYFGSLSGANLTSLSAPNLTGSVPTASLGSGTPDNTKYLRDDRQWVVPGMESLPSGLIAMAMGPCPSGWTRVTEWDNVFLRGAATYGATGGAATHGHTVNSHDHSIGLNTSQVLVSHIHAFGGSGATGQVSVTHTHGFSFSGTTTGGSSHVHSVYTVSVQSGSSFNAAGGVDTQAENGHTHGFSFSETTGSDSSTLHGHDFDFSGSTGDASSTLHNHSVNGSTGNASPGTDAQSNLPPWIGAVFCRKT